MAEPNSNLSPSTEADRPTAAPRAKLTADHPLMRELLVRYIGGLPAQLAMVISCAKQADLEQLRRLTHQLKGSGGSYGFPQITQFAARVEASITQGEPLRQIRSEVQALVDLVRGIPGYDIGMETKQRQAA